jgi:hypothetical protein
VPKLARRLGRVRCLPPAEARTSPRSAAVAALQAPRPPCRRVSRLPMKRPV